MKTQQTIGIQIKHHLFLITLAVVGVLLVLFSTKQYGSGLSPDSVGYIGTARNLINGLGLTNFTGSPFVVHPPLYPMVLGLFGQIFKTDPILLTNFLNALILGLITYFGGILAFKCLPLGFAVLGTFTILASIPLFNVSIMVWSEPLFILLLILSLVLATIFLSTRTYYSVIFLSMSVALSCLARYIGVTLILWGVIIIITSYSDNVKRKLVNLALFILISSLPLGLVLIHNYSITGSFFGPRLSSIFSLQQNLMYSFNTTFTWYIPDVIAEHRPTLILLGVLIGFITGLRPKQFWQSAKYALKKGYSLILFAFMYTSFLVISSTFTAIDAIGTRLLSPIYVPLTIFLLLFISRLVKEYKEYFSLKIVNSFLISGVAIFFVYTINSTINTTVAMREKGKGYSSIDWKTSETIQYLIDHQDIGRSTIYTNDPDAAYILGNVNTKMSPRKSGYNSDEPAMDISSLRGSWPEEENAYLVWFDATKRDYLFSTKELSEVAKFNLIVDLKDGDIYKVSN